ncbi:MAG: response regulator transcription factor [Lachnospiraceae bacterium]
MKVLIVEDEFRIREGIRKLLGKMRPEYEIIGEAEDGEEGMTMLSEKHPDIVITDIRMPKHDGLEMMTMAVEAGIPVKAIILSAYSEFEYARQAMKLGVTEYLLKPISLPDFAQALEHVEQQVEKEKRKKPAEIGTLEQVLRDVINGCEEPGEAVNTYLSHNYQIAAEQTFALVCVYLGANYDTDYQQSVRALEHAFSLYHDLSYCILDFAYRKLFVAVIYHYQDAHDLERWLQRQILSRRTGHLTLGWTEVTGIYSLKTGFDHLYPYMDWNISFNEEILISYPKITYVQTVPCIYPIEVETKIKVAVCSGAWDKVALLASEFHCSFQDGRIYVPREIKECYIRFLWAVLGIAKEIGRMDTRKLEQQKLLEQIMDAKRREELVAVTEFVLETIKQNNSLRETTHLTVQRTRSMIHEFYQSGITLEEIAVKLNLTPEYLGNQFHKEMGVTFSAYMKNHRINKAKELLCATSLKLYEIAAKVGYSDPKYFSKVFKETTGQLPADYRKTFK